MANRSHILSFPSGSGQATFDHTVFVTVGETETNLLDNQVTTQVDIYPYADIASQLELISQAPYYRGQEIEYKLRVVNAGVNHAHNLDINLIPENLELLWALGNTCETVDCNITQLNRFDEENIVLRYIIQNEGSFNLTASSNANEHDTSTSNNTDNAGGTAVLLTNDLIFKDSFED